MTKKQAVKIKKEIQTFLDDFSMGKTGYLKTFLQICQKETNKWDCSLCPFANCMFLSLNSIDEVCDKVIGGLIETNPR